MIITFDIETLQTTDAEVIETLRQSIKAPAQYKKPESIQQWMDENAEAALQELVSKTSFDALYGSIACIAWQIDGGEVQATEADDCEAAAIQRFFYAIENASRIAYHGGETSHQVTFCGHNVAGFDLPFLKQRAIILGLHPPHALRKAFSAKPWDIADTMLMWDSKKMVSMDKLCKALGLDGKGDFDGSMVNEEWTKSSKQKVIDYCKADVERTTQIYNRITFKE